MKIGRDPDGNGLVQATAVVIDGRAIMIVGRPGAGKSTLALSLIDRGAVLIGDDGVSLRQSKGGIEACPPPNIAGKLEIRGIGIVELPVTTAPLSLVLELEGKPERLPEEMRKMTVLDRDIPLLPFNASAPSAALRAEWALRVHGLPHTR